MNSYNFKWKVVIPATFFMAGIHRFKTKREAQKFCEDWKRANPTVATYADIPAVERTTRFGMGRQ